MPTHVPVFAMGMYAGAHRGVILEAKERLNLAVRPYVGAVLRSGLEFLIARGDIEHDTVLVPAPTRKRNARLRGGDPVAEYARSSGFAVCEALRLRSTSADQSELSAAQRRRNLAGAVELVASVPDLPIVVVDDVVTTGATLAASVERLLAAGAQVRAAIAIAAA
ncbi:hypothetical protein GCM10028828_07570 [Corynebacterium tapiri]